MFTMCFFMASFRLQNCKTELDFGVRKDVQFGVRENYKVFND